jgi:electron transfer flavoprotein alpha subunit
MAISILVFAERRDGEIKRASLEALSTARGLADKLGGRVDVLAIGPGAASCGAQVGRLGADRLLVMEADHGELYAPELYSACLAQVAEEGQASVVLLAATAMGKDLAPHATARLHTACASDLTEIELGDDGTLRGRRPIYSGKATARIAMPGAHPAVATLRPNAFPVCPTDPARIPEVVTLDPPASAEALRVRAVRLERPQQQELDVAEASIVVSGGRGLKEPENFSIIRELANALGGAVGASRAVVDAGWIPHTHQVGQTGKVVSPDLYVACGISGAVQHLAGMSSSRVIVAINKDPEAPIFKVAHYGIVGDVFEIVPALTEAVHELKAE